MSFRIVDAAQPNSSESDSSEPSETDSNGEPCNPEGAQGANQSQEDQPSEELQHDRFLLEDEPLEGETEGLIDFSNLIANYKERNDDIRESLSPQLSTTGLLLTLSLGSWYFVLKDSSGLPIHSTTFIIMLFTLTLLLTVSICCGIEAINKKVKPLAISTLEELQYTVDVHNSKRSWSTASIWALRSALIIILLALIFFGWEISHMDPAALNTSGKVDNQPTISLMLGPYNIPEIQELKKTLSENTSPIHQNLDVSVSLKCI